MEILVKTSEYKAVFYSVINTSIYKLRNRKGLSPLTKTLDLSFGDKCINQCTSK